MIPTSSHNEALSGDTLYSAFLNHEWREIVIPFIVRGMEQLAAAIEDESDRQDFEVLYGALIDDLYSEEIVDSTPVGAIMAYVDAEPPNSKWQLCNGDLLAVADHPDLFALIGYKYGSASGGTFFLKPDLRQKFILGFRNDEIEGVVFDETGGESEHTLSVAEMPVHSHAQRWQNTGGGATNALAQTTNRTTTVTTATPSTTGNAGSGDAHNNMPPFHSLIYLIKVLP